MEIDTIIKDLISYQFLGGVCAGCATVFFFVMSNQLSHYELYGEFLIWFAMFLVIMWWYPIYMEEINGNT